MSASDDLVSLVAGAGDIVEEEVVIKDGEQEIDDGSLVDPSESKGKAGSKVSSYAVGRSTDPVEAVEFPTVEAGLPDASPNNPTDETVSSLVVLET
jgi:hypothetical protein